MQTRKQFLLQTSLITTLLLSSQTALAGFPFHSCRDLHNKLYSCEAFECLEFNPVYPLTFIKHEIWGTKEDKCQYHQTTASTKMLCQYSLETRAKIVKLKDQFFQEYQEGLQKQYTDSIMRDPTSPTLDGRLGLNSDELFTECDISKTIDTDAITLRGSGDAA